MALEFSDAAAFLGGNNRCSCIVLTNHEGAKVNTERTVLDYLNDDSWQAILDYVPVRDIILSETVSRRWQQMVLKYLRKKRINIDIGGICLNGVRITPPANVRSVTLWLNGPLVRILGLPETSKTIKQWLQRVRPDVVASWCNTKRMYRAIRGHCPNLESITLVGLKHNLSVKKNDNINKVRQLSFVKCTFSDKCIDQFTRNNPVLEELGIYNSDMHGLYLTKMKSKCLKTLIFSECMGLRSNLLIPAVSLLKGLTKLILYKIPKGVYDKVHLLLNDMPYLEHFAIHVQFSGVVEGPNKKNMEYIASVCRLGNLEHLALAYDASNNDVASVTWYCTKLRRLELVNCYGVDWRGLTAMCYNAGERLEMLDVTGCDLTDDDVVGVVQRCPNLTSLNLQMCGSATTALVPRIAEARRALGPGGAGARLRLYLGHTCMWRQFDKYKAKYNDELMLQY